MLSIAKAQRTPGRRVALVGLTSELRGALETRGLPDSDLFAIYPQSPSSN
jgi:hypothetical protein